VHHALSNVKEEQKERARRIRNGKRVRKPHLLEQSPEFAEDLAALVRNRYEYRHWHIARCELCGTAREAIERPGPYNRPNESYIERIKQRIMEAIDGEDVRPRP